MGNDILGVGESTEALIEPIIQAEKSVEGIIETGERGIENIIVTGEKELASSVRFGIAALAGTIILGIYMTSYNPSPDNPKAIEAPSNEEKSVDTQASINKVKQDLKDTIKENVGKPVDVKVDAIKKTLDEPSITKKEEIIKDKIETRIDKAVKESDTPKQEEIKVTQAIRTVTGNPIDVIDGKWVRTNKDGDIIRDATIKEVDKHLDKKGDDKSVKKIKKKIKKELVKDRKNKRDIEGEKELLVIKHKFKRETKEMDAQRARDVKLTDIRIKEEKQKTDKLIKQAEISLGKKGGVTKVITEDGRLIKKFVTLIGQVILNPKTSLKDRKKLTNNLMKIAWAMFDNKIQATVEGVKLGLKFI